MTPETYCGYLEDFARDAAMLGVSSNSETVSPPEGKKNFAHYFDFSKYVERLRSRASTVRANDSNRAFVMCHRDGEVISVLQLEHASSMVSGDRPEMRLRSVDWPIEGLSHKFFLVPPRVVRSKIALRPWLEVQGYNLQDTASNDPYGI
jgi:hypothetical protein